MNILPSIWQSYINAILKCLQSRKHCEAIMDDSLLFTPSKKAHIAKLDYLLKALLKNGFKISPRKWQLLKTDVTCVWWRMSWCWLCLCYAIIGISMFILWWCQHMTSWGEPYKRGLQTNVYYRKCWFQADHICVIMSTSGKLMFCIVIPDK